MAKKLQRTTAHHITPFIKPEESTRRAEMRRIDIDRIRFAISPDEVARLDDGRREFGIIGQPRALKALHLSAQIRSKGYNLFVTGLPGTGRRTAVLNVLEDYREDISRLKDVVYVFNFKRPDMPSALYLPPGGGVAFRDALRNYVERIGDLIDQQARDESFKNHRDRRVVEVEGRENHIFQEFEKRLQSDGFQILRSSESEQADIVPVIDGKAHTFEELQEMLQQGALDKERWTSLRERYYRYVDEMASIYHRLRSDRAEVENELRGVRLQGLRPMLEERLDAVRRQFDSPEVSKHLDAMLGDILGKIELFLPQEQDGERDEAPESPTERYGVNVVVDHSETKKAPLIFEVYPDTQKRSIPGRQWPTRLSDLRCFRKPKLTARRRGSVRRFFPPEGCRESAAPPWFFRHPLSLRTERSA